MTITEPVTIPLTVEVHLDLTRVKRLASECSDLLDRLEQALTSAETVVGEPDPVLTRHGH